VEWTVDAQIRPRVEARSNHHFGLEDDRRYFNQADTFATFNQRTRLGVGAELDHLSGYAQVQHAGEWGLTGGDELSDPQTGLHQGWLRYEPDESWALKVGRQELVYGDARVLGNVDWSQNGRAWDAALVEWTPSEAVGLDVFAGRYEAGAFMSGFSGVDSLLVDDAYLTGAYLSLSEVAKPALDDIDVYALYDVQIDDLSDEQPNRQNVIGLGSRLAGKWGMVDGTAEGMYQLGSNCEEFGGVEEECTDETIDRRAWMIDAELGVELYEPNDVRAFAAFSHATGDDPETDETIEGYFQFYPTAHKWLGLMDLIGPRTNIQELRGGASASLGPVDLRESVHYFRRLEPEAESVGLEFDTTVGASLSDVLGLSAGHGLFVPEEGASSNGEPAGVANWVYLQLNGEF
ncbi:MAG: alginate export family protein, partial [Persicimonas sp.]